MKKELNILKFGYVYKNPIKNIPQVFRNIKYAYQRIVQGYCEADLWNLDSHFLRLFEYTIEDLASISHGWPSNKFKTPEEYEKYLREISEHFRNAQEWNLEVPLNKEADDLMEELMKLEDDNTIKSSEEHKLLRNKWLAKEEEASQFREQEKNKGFDMMKNIFFSLWD